jgi:hypothetical protein
MANFTNLDNANRQIDRLRKRLQWYESQLAHARDSLRNAKMGMENTLLNIKQSPRSWDMPSEKWAPTFTRIQADVDSGLRFLQEADKAEKGS